MISYNENRMTRERETHTQVRKKQTKLPTIYHDKLYLLTYVDPGVLDTFLCFDNYNNMGKF